MSPGRIVFTDSPWPAGHPLERIGLTVRADDQGKLRLHLHAESTAYDAEQPGVAVEAVRPDLPRSGKPQGWENPETWLQYRSAIISTSKWDNAGFELPWPADKFDESLLGTEEYTADPVKSVDLGGPAEELAAGAYVLGQDLSADHHVWLTRTAPNVFDVRWQGAIAATFIGEEDFSAGHRFEIVADGVRLS